MASAKVETWKKKAKSAIDGLGKEFESVAKELAEFDTEMAKKRKAIQDRLSKSAEEVAKKIKLDGFAEADMEEVRKADEELRKTAKDKGAVLKGYASVDPSAHDNRFIDRNLLRHSVEENVDVNDVSGQRMRG